MIIKVTYQLWSYDDGYDTSEIKNFKYEEASPEQIAQSTMKYISNTGKEPQHKKPILTADGDIVYDVFGYIDTDRYLNYFNDVRDRIKNELLKPFIVSIKRKEKLSELLSY